MVQLNMVPCHGKERNLSSDAISINAVLAVVWINAVLEASGIKRML